MQTFERNYMQLLQTILASGNYRQTRNGGTLSMFAMNLHVDVGNTFPILQARKMYPTGVLGELAAMLRGPKHLDDFTKWGCNYWKQWANEDGSINVDYGNAWLENGQMDHLFHCLEHNNTDRRMLISGWRPEKLSELNLPCCHYSYQFYVENGRLHMLWSQRSVDMMIGLPSDIVFAAAWLIALARQFGYAPGFISMSLGDCHIYEEHLDAARLYIDRVLHDTTVCETGISYTYKPPVGFSSLDFVPSDLELHDYNPLGKLDLELKA